MAEASTPLPDRPNLIRLRYKIIAYVATWLIALAATAPGLWQLAWMFPLGLVAVFDRHLATLRGEHRRRRNAIVQAIRRHVPPGALRYQVPDGGMYLWCQLAPRLRARTVQEAAARESVIVVTGEPFYVDQGGAGELRICYTSQPVDRAERVARTLARGLGAAAREAREAGDPPAMVRLV